jgi:tRNA-2-methylthio-N6-dimethylallyladenosine synthase
VLRAIEGNALTRNRARIGSAEEIYVRHGRTGEGHAIGETWSGHAVHVPTDSEAGRYVTAAIEDAGPHVLYAGNPVGPPR